MFEDRMRRLARRLDRVAEKDRQQVEREREFEELRRGAAVGLHSMCASFVNSLNGMVHGSKIELSPAAFAKEDFQEGRETLFQIHANGRVIQLSFVCTGPLVVTDDLKTPYTLEGTVHWYNHEMLEREDVQEHRLFFCVVKEGAEWRFYDPASYRTGKLNSDYFAERLESLL
jgi:hypothetical protein